MNLNQPIELLRRAMRPHLVWEGGWVFLGQVATFAGSLLALKALTQFLPPEVYGQLNLITVAMILPGWILFAPFVQSSVRMYAASREAGLLSSMLSTAIGAHVALSLSVSVLAIPLIFSGLPDLLGLPRVVVALAVLAFLIEMWHAFGLSVCGAARRRAEVAILSTATVWLRPLWAVALVWSLGASVATALGGYLMGSLMVLPFALRSVWRDLQITPRRGFQARLLREMIAYGSPFAMWSILAWANNYLDRYVLEWLLGGAAVGPYVAAVQVAGLPFNQGSGFVSALLVPIAFERAGAGSEAGRLDLASTLVSHVAGFFAIAGLPVVSLYWMAGDRLMGLLTHASYAMPASVLTILALGALARSAAQLLAVSVLVYNRPTLLIGAHAAPAVLSLPLSWILIRIAGVRGAAVANAATSLVFFAILLGLTRTMRPADRAIEPGMDQTIAVSKSLAGSRNRG